LTKELTDARRLLDAKTSVPGELRTAEWARVRQWERERAFYMAGVAQAEILDEFRKEVAGIVNGETSIPQAERRLTAFLDAAGYKPEPGQEGTIKDLRSWRRMRVALRTNVELLQGWGQKERGMTLGAMTAAPAWELVRVMPRSVPRDWKLRFDLSGGIERGGRMIAMKGSQVWRDLGGFEDGLGVDYPPFAWGSGMGWMAVGFREAKALGVIPDGWVPPERVMASPNENLQATPEVDSQDLRGALANRLQGLAEWDEKRLVFTDPNGTRPYPAAKVAEVITAKLPNGFRNFAAKSVEAWAKDALAINLKRGRDITDDFVRTVGRIHPLPPETPVWRGERFAREADLLERIEDLMAGVRVRDAAQSWTRLPGVAAKFANLGKLPYRLVLHSKKHGTLHSIQPLVKEIFPKHWKQAEAISLEGSQWRAAGEPAFVRTGKVLEIHLEVEEL
jgi:hypothetical protein